MREIDRIANELERVVHGDAWHGPALLELIGDVDDTAADAKPAGAAHSIHELVLHIAVWLDVVRRRLGGEAYQPTPAEDWPDARSGPRAWSDAVQHVERCAQQLLVKLRALGDDALDRKVPGKSYHADHMLHGIVHHTAYHCGQIAVLKRLIE
jgi:uncharacterized damage-inducible protein DinB